MAYKIKNLIYYFDRNMISIVSYKDLVAFNLVDAFLNDPDFKKLLCEYYLVQHSGIRNVFVNDAYGIYKKNGRFFLSDYTITNKKDAIKTSYTTKQDISEYGKKLIPYDERLFFSLLLIKNRSLGKKFDKELEEMILGYIKPYDYEEVSRFAVPKTRVIKKFIIDSQYTIRIETTERGKLIVESKNKALDEICKVLNISDETLHDYNLAVYLVIYESNGNSIYHNNKDFTKTKFSRYENKKTKIEITRNGWIRKEITKTKIVDEKLFLTIWYLLANSYGENKEFNKIMDKYGELLPYEEVK